MEDKQELVWIACDPDAGGGQSFTSIISRVPTRRSDATRNVHFFGVDSLAELEKMLPQIMKLNKETFIVDCEKRNNLTLKKK